MRNRLVASALAVAVAVAGTIAYNDRSADNGRAEAAKRRGPYLGPRGGGNSWVPSRPTKKSIVWAVGDADNNTHGRAVAAMVAAQRVDRFLYLGDVYETGTASEFATRYAPLYSGFNPIAAPTSGNHEWPNVSTGYIPYWTAARGTPPPFWYAFVVSGWQVISLNSNVPSAEGSPQLTWLRTMLASSPRFGNCRIMIAHHPPSSAGFHGDIPTLDTAVQALTGQATITIAGHDHAMERLRPVNGITPLVDGSGGRALTPVNRADPRLAFADDKNYGALQLKLKPGHALLTFVAENGVPLDQSQVNCRQA